MYQSIPKPPIPPPPGQSPGIWPALSSVQWGIGPKIWLSCQNVCPLSETKLFRNRLRSMYQYSNMAPRLSRQTSIFGVVFFISKSLLGIKRQKKLWKFAIFTRKPRIHVRILIYRTWPILWYSTWAAFTGHCSCPFHVGFCVALVLCSYIVEYAFV